MKRVIAICSTLFLVGAFAVNSLGGSASASLSGTTIRGAIGGDFDTQLPAGSLNGADWAVVQSFRAGNHIHDSNVFIVVSTWNGSGLQPTTSDGPGPCHGSVKTPTAPRGDVCIYVTNSDNALNLNGYSIMPGSGGSSFGFKLHWDASVNGDTFVDAVWAYRYP
jgi:hypothetical protein